MRFQSQVPRTIMHFTSVILTLLARADAVRWNGAAKAAPVAVIRKSRRFIGRYSIKSGRDAAPRQIAMLRSADEAARDPRCACTAARCRSSYRAGASNVV